MKESKTPTPRRKSSGPSTPKTEVPVADTKSTEVTSSGPTVDSQCDKKASTSGATPVHKSLPSATPQPSQATNESASQPSSQKTMGKTSAPSPAQEGRPATGGTDATPPTPIPSSMRDMQTPPSGASSALHALLSSPPVPTGGTDATPPTPIPSSMRDMQTPPSGASSALHALLSSPPVPAATLKPAQATTESASQPSSHKTMEKTSASSPAQEGRPATGGTDATPPTPIPSSMRDMQAPPSGASSALHALLSIPPVPTVTLKPTQATTESASRPASQRKSSLRKSSLPRVAKPERPSRGTEATDTDSLCGNQASAPDISPSLGNFPSNLPGLSVTTQANTEHASPPSPQRARGKSAHRTHSREITEDRDGPLKSHKVKRHGRKKKHHRSHDGHVTNNAPAVVREISHQESTNTNGNGTHEGPTVGSDAFSGNLSNEMCSVDTNLAKGTANASASAKKTRKRKSRKTASHTSLSQNSDYSEVHREPPLHNKPPQDASMLDTSCTHSKSDIPALVNVAQLDTIFLEEKAGLTEASVSASLHGNTPQRASLSQSEITVSANISEAPKEQVVHSKQETEAENWRETRLPSWEGPLTGSPPSKQSSTEHSGGHSPKMLTARAAAVNGELLDLPRQKISLSTKVSDAQLPDQRAPSPSKEAEGERAALDHTGFSLATVERDERQRDGPQDFPVSGKSAGAASAPGALQPTSLQPNVETVKEKERPALRRIWGGPFSGLSTKCSTPQPSGSYASSVSLAQGHEAKSEARSTPHNPTSSSAGATYREVQRHRSHQQVLSPTFGPKRKGTGHEFNESAYSSIIAESRSLRDVPRLKERSLSSELLHESSEYCTSEGSYVPSPHAEEYEKQAKGPQKVPSMSLVLIEDLPQSPPSCISQAIALHSGPFEPEDFCPEPPRPIAKDELRKKKKAARKHRKTKSEKSPKSESTARESSSAPTGQQSLEKPAEKSQHSSPKESPASVPVPADELNRRLRSLRSHDDFSPTSGATSPLRPEDFGQDHASVNEEGEVKLYLDVSTREATGMLWPFGPDSTVTKKEDPQLQ
ncbi:hypothetical protein V5799_020210 [Amblyomma americanum]|uniref:Uncharacterized protein n=1 Tax=Amblyomma americanum TaxID=6943 RepID=A0AAQ4EUH9_AMBAM